MKRCLARFRHAVLLGALFSPAMAVAQGRLPTMEDPSRGAGNGIIQTIQNYGYDMVLLIALLVVAGMFIGVCYHAYTRYSEIHIRLPSRDSCDVQGQ
ncbi:TIGR03745 family integrating conjugative element membrane protein [Stenotrophomonas maltophilia]|uniref:TIGR03745 family integrating conjugative element membrane protein n=1 Tax=Stenotrophomonas maltophilia group TaxID=995085 RepID=UPI000DF81924|nr:TIGR03745 family integrating conjugative element membrane protein [Stenotrophomonas maltophilia]MBH1444222.1 TIGR03745 family integrating conjugative element membrane protein [Stenotrophomonas maltophilia]MBH1450960.1 TIGR03745 family integrating conjugative element membrane protein [Stenotrophomonas maltophilia]MBH1566228.1 TIGR03745 family integrating conjugative element membrane protein [Stenotrophomonas maltophilia]MBH1727779.1 TIGR03745 family integrating conjugative element membrane pr